jgi:hypothetical protein
MLNLLSQIASNASEAYYSIGAFNHVIGSMFFFNTSQEKEPDRTFIEFLSNTALIHSIIDNFAFFVDAYIMHRDNILYPLKYLERIMNAFKILLLKSGIVIKSDIEDSDNIFYIMNLLKQHIRNRTSGEIMKNINDYPDISKFIGDDLLTSSNKVGGSNMQNNTQYPSPNMDPQQNTYPSPNMDPQQNTYPSPNMDPRQNTYPSANMDPQQNTYPSANMDPQQNTYPSPNMDPSANTSPNIDSYPNTYPLQNTDSSPNTDSLQNTDSSVYNQSTTNIQDAIKIKKAIDIKFKRLFKKFVQSYLITDLKYIKKFNKIAKEKDNMNFYILVILFSLKNFCNEENTNITIKVSRYPIVIKL